MSEQYQSGFANYLSSEAEVGALPHEQNAPQHCPLGLYAEQLSGSAFTAPRAHNLRSWLYRIRPSVLHSAEAKHYTQPYLFDHHTNQPWMTPPTQLRWDPLPLQADDFFDGLYTIATNPVAAIHLYHAKQTDTNRFFYNADGDWLIIPVDGELSLQTEFGEITVKPLEIAVIQRGIRFAVSHTGVVSGYICESQDGNFMLPERGLIGANGLGEERYFKAPTAHYLDNSGDYTLLCKFNSQLWQMSIDHHPLDVVAWHGNYYPYKYALKDFVPVFSALKDHADPSIFTLLTVPSVRPGIANIDFVLFPPRWMVAEDSFRPPYYHRNIMSEFMGLITGQYDAKQDGFVPGGCSLHNCMSAHGVDQEAFVKAIDCDTTKPERYAQTMAFMLESSQIWQVTEQALNATHRQANYLQCWLGLQKRFKA